MIVRQLRNATVLVSVGPHRLLVDPMLSPVAAMPGFRMVGARRRNPLVPLPQEAEAALASATAVVITHEHPDHVDAAGRAWIMERGLPVWTNGVDAPSLAKKGLDVHVLSDGSLGLEVEIVRSRHGKGLLGWVLGPVTGYYLAHPDEPSLYLIGDSVLTESVIEAVERLQPDVIVAPAGAANMGIGGNILFSVEELVVLAKKARGKVIFNHLEALDHCPTTRQELRARMASEGLADRVLVPEDGEVLSFERPPAASPSRARPRPHAAERPGFQKWLSSKIAGA